MAIDVYAIPKRMTRAACERLTSEQLEVVKRRLHQRDPNDELNSVEAAIHTGVCVRTIKRAIDAGKGPKRLKNPDTSGRSAVNRHTTFIKGDLDAWRASLRSFDTFHGTFNRFDDLINDEPWIMAGSKVVGHLFDVGDIDDVMEILASGEVEFFRLDEALRERWTDNALRTYYQRKFLSIHETVQSDRAAAAQQAALELETPDVSGARARPGL